MPCRRPSRAELQASGVSTVEAVTGPRAAASGCHPGLEAGRQAATQKGRRCDGLQCLALASIALRVPNRGEIG
jgi:hypothetical protein